MINPREQVQQQQLLAWQNGYAGCGVGRILPVSRRELESISADIGKCNRGDRHVRAAEEHSAVPGDITPGD